MGRSPDEHSSDGSSPPSANVNPMELDTYHRRGEEEEGFEGFDGQSSRASMYHSANTHGADEENDGGEMSVTSAVKKSANKLFRMAALLIAAYITGWFSCSLSLSLYNKWMFGTHQLDFHFPLFTSSFHMIVQYCFATTGLYFFPRLRPRHGTSASSSSASANSSDSHPPFRDVFRVMSPRVYFFMVVPCGIATGLDIGLGNASLQSVTLTFFTMCKSSTLMYVLLAAFIFGLEKPSWNLVALMLLMSAGVCLMVAGETEFSAIGFTLLMIASACSGIRWALTQMLLRHHPATHNPIASLFFLTPVMFVVLFTCGLLQEGTSTFLEGVRGLANEWGWLLGIVILLVPGCLAFFMTLFEFALIKETSVITLSVGGIFKEILTVMAGRQYFHEKLTTINLVGLVVTIAAVAIYNWMKIKQMRREKLREAQNEVAEERAPMLSTSDHTSDHSRSNHNHSNGDDESTATLLRRSLSVSTHRSPRPPAREPPPSSPLVKQNVE